MGLPREIAEVMVETEVKNALVRLNPEISAQPECAEEVFQAAFQIGSKKGSL